MTDKTEKELLWELYQAVIGIPDSPIDNGLIGKVDVLMQKVELQNNRISKSEMKISRIWGILLGIGSIGGLTGAGLGIGRLIGG